MTPPRFQIRPAVPTDFVAIVALERVTERAPHWPPPTYAAILDAAETGPARCLFVAHHDQHLAGFAVGLIHPAPGDSFSRTAELESIVVATSVRRAGLGRALCSTVVDWASSRGATEIILEVRASSTGAIALYSGLGFTQTGRRPRYYRGPDDDALVMRLTLQHAPASTPAPPGAEA